MAGSAARPTDTAPPRFYELTSVAQDPSIKDPDSGDPEKSMLRALVRIPAHVVTPGPRGPRFHVVDYDPVSRQLEPPFALAGRGTVRDRFAVPADRELLADRR